MVEKEIHEKDGCGGGGVSNHNVKIENTDKSLWVVGGFLLALIILATVLAII